MFTICVLLILFLSFSQQCKFLFENERKSVHRGCIQCALAINTCVCAFYICMCKFSVFCDLFLDVLMSVNYSHIGSVLMLKRVRIFQESSYFDLYDVAHSKFQHRSFYLLDQPIKSSVAKCLGMYPDVCFVTQFLIGQLRRQSIINIHAVKVEML